MVTSVQSAQQSRFVGTRSMPWRRPQGIEQVLTAWQNNARHQKAIVYRGEQCARDACFVDMPQGIAEPLRQALAQQNKTRLYKHQAEAIVNALARRHTAIATPTASGKSLCYNLPVLTRLIDNAEARALFLFPTKALARDQEEATRTLMRAANIKVGATTFDGDTPNNQRKAAKEQGGIIITNPDMLHSGILPHHTGWSRLFSNLTYIVLDELHTYRGVFGSHVANVMRRLLRIARFYGAKPTFILASATIGNAQEHAQNIIGDDVVLIDDNAAPMAKRSVVIYNPPVVNAELGLRQSSLKASVALTMDLMRAKVTTLLFGQSRNSVETMLKYLRDQAQEDPHLDGDAIHAYRGGYLPQTRRRIEASLRDGTIKCVVATQALELGIDIGALEAVVCCGYPGTVAGLWQRFGRGGRRGQESLACLVASSSSLDQYFAHAPETLLAADIEHARIDADNVDILMQHLKCAAFELPFKDDDHFGKLPQDALHDALDFLVDHQVLNKNTAQHAGEETLYHWATEHYPAQSVSLRQVSWDNFVIINVKDDTVLAEMDWRSAHTMLHTQAIYQHDAAQYQVEHLDYDNRKAYVRFVEPDYYTDAMTHVKIKALDVSDSHHKPWPQAHQVVANLGDVSVVARVVGFKKIRFHTHENVGFGEVNLPEMQLHTTAMWLVFAAEAVTAFEAPRAQVIDALRGIAQALHTVAAMGLMVDPKDIGHTLETGQDGVWPYAPALYLYDQTPGGIGLAPRLYERREELMHRGMALIARCECTHGCPACLGPVDPELAHAAGRKPLALALMQHVGIVPTRP